MPVPPLPLAMATRTAATSSPAAEPRARSRSTQVPQPLHRLSSMSSRSRALMAPVRHELSQAPQTRQSSGRAHDGDHLARRRFADGRFAERGQPLGRKGGGGKADANATPVAPAKAVAPPFAEIATLAMVAAGAAARAGTRSLAVPAAPAATCQGCHAGRSHLGRASGALIVARRPVPLPAKPGRSRARRPTPSRGLAGVDCASSTGGLSAAPRCQPYIPVAWYWLR